MDELIRRAEIVERSAWTALFRGAAPVVQDALGLEVTERSGATVLSASRASHLLLNRAIGIGSPPYNQALAAEAVEHYRSRGIERFWIHLRSDQRYTVLPGLLGLEGLRPYPRSWMKFVRRTLPVATSRGPVPRLARRSEADEVSQLLASGFDFPSHAGRFFSAAVPDDNWRFLVVDRGSGIVAAGALFVLGKDGYLAFAATDQDSRRLGCQRALIAGRLDLARQLGCRRVFTETGLPIQGKANSSYRNMLRLGFDELCVRDNFCPEGTTWTNPPSWDAGERSTGLPPQSRTRDKVVVRSGS